MGAGGIHRVEFLILALLLVIAVLTTLARRFHTPYPIVLVIGGLILSLFPRLPHISLSPHLVFLVFLPPLVFSGAFNTSWRDFRYNLVSILLLAFGLVGFTVMGVSIATDWLLPGFDRRLGFALGAVISTTDTIAAMSIARRLGLPGSITDVLEGESLVNDASGLLALEFAVAMVVNGETPSLRMGLLHFHGLLIGGILIGLLAAKLIHILQRRISDPPVEITVTLVAPYLAYLSAEALHTSGVLATVACGLYLGRKRSELFSTFARLDSSAVWNTLDFILNGVVFILIGLQLPFILSGIRGIGRGELIRDGVIFSVLVIALRLIWIYPGTWLAYWIRHRLLHQNVSRPGMRSTFVVGWTGMRGVIALAAAISLPEYLNNGAPFPQRNVIIFLTFCVILVTLVLQGLTLPALIRKLGIQSKGGNAEEEQARRHMLRAALEYLEHLERLEHSEKIRKAAEAPEDAWVLEDLTHHYQQRLALLGETEEHQPQLNSTGYRRYRELAGRLRGVERSVLLRLRDENEINDEVLRDLERELDLQDARYLSHS